MNSDIAVKLENVSKYYKLYDSPRDRLKEALSPFRKKYHREFIALDDISFELKRSECLGIIGRNGAGKSTILKLIAHIVEPSSGFVYVNGSVSALLELGTGFNPEFSGMQNIYFYGTILGFRKNEIEKKVREIIEFADIGDFIDQPVKTYSSGMFVRLAFAVQTSLTPDILLVDEVLSVGDIFFQQKCHARIEELLQKGTALILVSHDMQMIEKYSDHTLLLQEDRSFIYGAPNDVIYSYYKFDKQNKIMGNIKLNKSIERSDIDDLTQSKVFTWPDEEYLTTPDVSYNTEIADCTGIALLNNKNKPCDSFLIGETAFVYYEVLLKKDIAFPVGMVTIINSKNMVVHAKDTLQYESSFKNMSVCSAGVKLRFIQSFHLSLSEGDYTISVGVGQVNPDDISRIRQADYSTRSNFMENVLGVVKPVFFSIRPNINNMGFPFHGYVDLGGDYVLQTVKKSMKDG